MSKLVALRLLMYIQLATGLIRAAPFAGVTVSLSLGVVHLVIGIIAVILAPLALGPVDGIPESTVRRLARMAPLAPLLIGLGLRFGVLLSPWWILVHVLLGIATIALIEMAAARQRRALAVASSE